MMIPRLFTVDFTSRPKTKIEISRDFLVAHGGPQVMPNSGN